MKASSQGFTLIGLAVVVAIIGLLLGGLLLPLATQVDIRRIEDTEKRLAEVKEALLGYALSDPANRLPCPDTDGDGIAEVPPCVNVEGTVPWATLGVEPLDPWGRPIRYLADNNYTAAIGVPNPPDTAGGLSVTDRAGTALTDSGTPINGPAAIIFSCGKNGVPDPGVGGFGVDPGNDNDDTANPSADCTNPGASDGIYVQDSFAQGTFDDVLIWVSKHTLLNRLVQAGVWP